METMPGFDFFVGGLEDGIAAALNAAITYPKQVAVYGGELDSENLRVALGDLIASFPLFLVSYGEGKDVESPPTPPVPPTLPRFFKHECSFAVYCVSDDARSEQDRRRSNDAVGIGVYKMIADAREALSGLQVKAASAEGEGAPILLNPEPLKPAGVEYIARMPGLTAYMVLFTTYFRYQTPDRSATGPLVRELVFEVKNTEKGEANLPGVVVRSDR